MSEVTTITGNFSPEYLDWRRLRSALETSGGDPFGVFVRMEHLLDGQAWHRLSREDGAPFSSFSEFVRDESKGLGMDPAELRKLLEVVGETERKGQHGDLFERVRAGVEVALLEEIPAARKAKGRPQDKGSATPVAVRDHTADATIARLKRDDPALAERVVAGEMTPHAAARLSGWRKPRVLITSPASVCRRLADEWTATEIAEAAALLAAAAKEKS